MEDPDSIFHYYQKLIRLRKEYPVIARGDFIPMAERHPQVLAYERRDQEDRLAVICNFYGRELEWTPEAELNGCECLLSNYGNPRYEKTVRLRPYEAMVLYGR